MSDRRREDVKQHASWYFPEGFADWLGEHAALIDALVMLRRAANESSAVDALLALQPVLLLRLSWELWPKVGFDPDADPQELLEARLPVEVIARCRYALWGEEPVIDAPYLRPV